MKVFPRILEVLSDGEENFVYISNSSSTDRLLFFRIKRSDPKVVSFYPRKGIVEPETTFKIEIKLHRNDVSAARILVQLVAVRRSEFSGNYADDWINGHRGGMVSKIVDIRRKGHSLISGVNAFCDTSLVSVLSQDNYKMGAAAAKKSMESSHLNSTSFLKSGSPSCELTLHPAKLGETVRNESELNKNGVICEHRHEADKCIKLNEPGGLLDCSEVDEEDKTWEQCQMEKGTGKKLAGKVLKKRDSGDVHDVEHLNVLNGKARISHQDEKFNEDGREQSGRDKQMVEKQRENDQKLQFEAERQKWIIKKELQDAARRADIDKQNQAKEEEERAIQEKCQQKIEEEKKKKAEEQRLKELAAEKKQKFDDLREEEEQQQKRDVMRQQYKEDERKIEEEHRKKMDEERKIDEEHQKEMEEERKADEQHQRAKQREKLRQRRLDEHCQQERAKQRRIDEVQRQEKEKQRRIDLENQKDRQRQRKIDKQLEEEKAKWKLAEIIQMEQCENQKREVEKQHQSVVQELKVLEEKRFLEVEDSMMRDEQRTEDESLLKKIEQQRQNVINELNAVGLRCNEEKEQLRKIVGQRHEVMIELGQMEEQRQIKIVDLRRMEEICEMERMEVEKRRIQQEKDMEVQKLKLRMKLKEQKEAVEEDIRQLQLEAEIKESRIRRDKQQQDQERRYEQSMQANDDDYRQREIIYEHETIDKKSDNERHGAGSQEVEFDLDTTLATDLNQLKDSRREREVGRYAPHSNAVDSMRKSHLDSGFDESGD